MVNSTISGNNAGMTRVVGIETDGSGLVAINVGTVITQNTTVGIRVRASGSRRGRGPFECHWCDHQRQYGVRWSWRRDRQRGLGRRDNRR